MVRSGQMVHMNNNLICAIDIETTGLEVGYHDIYQIAIVPLDSNFKPDKRIIPFYLDLKPHHPHHADKKAISQEKLARVILNGMDAYRAADFLQEWFDKKLDLPLGKMICPLAQNWPFDSAFIRHWLGNHQYNNTFHAWYRDLIPVTLRDNDSAYHNVEQIPYPKSNLGFLCARLGVVNETPHDAMSDAVATAECWRLLLKRGFLKVPTVSSQGT